MKTERGTFIIIIIFIISIIIIKRNERAREPNKQYN